MIVIVDSQDCFTFNLVQYVRELATGVPMRVVRNDEVAAAEIVSWRPRAIILADGPGRPELAGMCVDLVRLAPAIPLLGVCLGHEAMAAAHGAQVTQAPEPRHARTSEVFHNGQGIFAGMPASFIAARFHALIVKRDTLPGDLVVTAWTRNGLIMGLQHREQPHFGVQFHPESHLTHTGKRLIGNFLALCGLPGR